MIEWIILLALAIWSILFDEVCELTDGMNPGFTWIFYFVDNGPRNFMDCVNGVRPAACGV